MLPLFSPSLYLKALPWALCILISILYLGKRDDLANCKAGQVFQNAAVLQFTKAQEAVVNQQKEVDKVAERFRADGYKNLDTVRTAAVPQDCNAAVQWGINQLAEN